MTSEQFHLPMFRFRDNEGLPCCAVNVEVPEGSCVFHATKSFGTREWCWRMDVELYRRGKGYGSIIPATGCPVWKDKV